MVSVRPGRLLAAGFGVAPSQARYSAEQPPLSRLLQRAGSLAARTIEEANRIIIGARSSSSSASRAPALAALALAALSIAAITGEGKQKEGKVESGKGIEQGEDE